jgi:hypothetical protein
MSAVRIASRHILMLMCSVVFLFLCCFPLPPLFSSSAVLLSVFLGVITISLTKTIDKSKFKDEQRNTIRYFKRLFPGNKATVEKLFATFQDLDMVRHTMSLIL